MKHDAQAWRSPPTTPPTSCLCARQGSTRETHTHTHSHFSFRWLLWVAMGTFPWQISEFSSPPPPPTRLCISLSSRTTGLWMDGQEKQKYFISKHETLTWTQSCSELPHNPCSLHSVYQEVTFSTHCRRFQFSIVMKGNFVWQQQKPDRKGEITKMCWHAVGGDCWDLALQK